MTLAMLPCDSMPTPMPPRAFSSSFSRFVQDVTMVTREEGQALAVQRLPDGRTTLILRVHEEAQNGADGTKGDLYVGGPRMRAIFKRTHDVARVVAFTLKPGWSASLLGVAASTLTERVVPLEDLWGRAGRDLCADLLAARGLPEIIERFARAIAIRTNGTNEPASAHLARQAVRLLEGEEVRMESVAERLGVTGRHLRRAFLESVGIGPKEFARTVRLQRAVRSASSARASDWARIATDAGYYDQAHLIADFHELVGLTPGAYLKRSAASL